MHFYPYLMIARVRVSLKITQDLEKIIQKEMNM
jgi:hypothetical protein